MGISMRPDREMREMIERVVKSASPVEAGLTGEEIGTLAQNLSIYHSELIYQNEELSRINQELQASERRYTDLYSYAPVSYLILNFDGQIFSANKAFCKMIGADQINICKNRLSSYLAASSQDAYYFFLQGLNRNSNFREKIELVFRGEHGDIPTEVYLNYYEENGIYLIRATIFDMSETSSLLEQLRLEKERYQIIAEQAHDILFEYFVEQDTMVFSQRYYELTGNNPVVKNYLHSMLIENMIYQDDLPKFREIFEQIQEHRKNIQCDMRLRRGKEQYIWYRIIATSLFDGNVPIRVVGTITDIDERVRESEALRKAAEIDPLTKLLNKGTIRRKIEEFLQREGPQGTHALMVIDVDNFKAVNDRLGHLFGDAVLTEISAKLSAVLSEDSLLGRIGGDEFIVLQKNCTPESIRERADEICSIIKGILVNERTDCALSGSVGVCLYPQDAVTYTDLFRKADIALYSAKMLGKNRFAFFSDGQNAPLDNAGLLNRYEEAEPHQERHYADLLFVTNIIELLYEGKNTASSVQLILSMLGNYFKVDHVGLTEFDKELGYFKTTYEWYMNACDRRMDGMQTFTLSSMASYSKMFNSDGLFCCYDMDILRDSSPEIWKKVSGIGVRTSLQCAMMDSGSFVGFMALDDFQKSRSWSQEDVNSFMLIGKTIAAYLVMLRMQRESERFANIDALTHSWNLNKFSKEAADMLHSLRDLSTALVTLDIRDFKYYNDRYGYGEGNRILVAFSRALRRELYGNEMFARISADQFVVLLHFKAPEELHSRVQAFLDRLSHLPRPEAGTYKLTVLAGVCIIRPQDTEITAIIDRANVARKTIKKSHKSIAAYYGGKLEEQALRTKVIEEAMEDALSNREFFVVYQPKVKLSGNAICGAEALIRWRSPTMGLVFPDSFIPVVEKNGFVVELDFFVLEEVCKQIVLWRQYRKDDFCIAINFSRLHVGLHNSVPRAKEIIARYQVPPQMIEVEITESAFAKDVDDLLAYIGQLRDAGFRIAMDDFGAGYSSLNLLKDLPIDVLKLDRNFFRGDQISGREKTVITSVVQMAHQLGMSIVSEGVETSEQAVYLRDIGCEMAQGYLFSRPMSVEQFEEALIGTAL